MGWKNPPPLFCTDTETVADLANEALRTHQPSKQHLLDIRAEAVEPLPAPLLTKEHAALKRDPYLQRPNAKLLSYVDVFVDDFLGLAQGLGTAAAMCAAHSFMRWTRCFGPWTGRTPPSASKC